MASQEQFLSVIDRDEAERRLHAAISLEPLGEEVVNLHNALGRVVSRDIIAAIDVPSFDRSNYDGFAVQAANTFEAQEEKPRSLKLLPEVISTAKVPETNVENGTAIAIATGGMLPRGADAIMMVEHADTIGDRLEVRKAVTPGFGVAYAGTDVTSGETVVRRNEVLTSRETGVLAAVGVGSVSVWQRAQVAIISTGDEIIEPGEAMSPGMVYDSNARILADAITELGGQPKMFGIVNDKLELLRHRTEEAVQSCDVILLSGGTSKGAGDLTYRVVSEWTDPGIVAHGVALKPGKPICLAVTQGKPVIVLPGFPTSAIFTFHEFVAPIIRKLSGRSTKPPGSIQAQMAVKVNSEIGRTEYLLVGLVHRNSTDDSQPSLAAYPMGKGSGSVTTFSRADGFVTIGRHEEIVLAGTTVQVQLLGRDLQLADLVVIGSHCVGLDFLIGKLQDRGFRAKFLTVGSTAGLAAAQRGECDLAGIHLLDPASNRYNVPFLTPDLDLVSGYCRQQGILFRREDPRFDGNEAAAVIAKVKDDPECRMVNRNQGSGTRILIDRYLAGSHPPGYAIQTRSHNAVAVAVAQRRADWGIAIESVARRTDLGFIPLADEEYDFVVPKSRSQVPAVLAFRQLLSQPDIRQQLAEMGLRISLSGT